MNEKKLTEKVDFTPEILAELKHHRQRTNKAPMALLKGRKNELPVGLKSYHVTNWLAGTKSANKEHLDYVLALWRELPDYVADPVVEKIEEPRIALTPEIIQEIREQHARTGVKAIGFMRQFKSSAPEGLTANIIQSWTDGGTKTIKTEYLDFVLEHYEQMKQMQINLTFFDTDQLQAQIERTGVDVVGLIEVAENKPEGLTSVMIQGWVNRQTRTARKDHFEYVLELWNSLPDKI